MGCFSYICKNSGEPVNSDSFDGDPVFLFLLEDGEVIEMMYGNYDSYGRVFDGMSGSLEWQKDWGECVDLHFDGNPSNGFAGILAEHYTGHRPHEISENDPEQGWTKTDFFRTEVVEEPYHRVLPLTTD